MQTNYNYNIHIIFTWKCKGPRPDKKNLKENKVQGITLSHSKNYEKFMVKDFMILV